MEKKRAVFIVEKKETLLLLEDFLGEYHLPSGCFSDEGKLPFELSRIIMEQLGLEIKKIKEHMRAKDPRGSLFIIEVHDPEYLLLKEYKGYAWVDPKEAFGYPIKEDLREILDLYLKLKQS